jgi:UDP-N-acetylglucosamine 4,6-dehydratase/5-epimerase
MAKAEDLGSYFRIPADTRDLNYGKFFSEGFVDMEKIEDYTSHNTERLNIEETKRLLLKLRTIRKDVLGEDSENVYEP